MDVQKIEDFLEKHEYCGIFLFLSLLLVIFFLDIIFLNGTFSTAINSPGTMPDGPYNYSGPRWSYSPVIDPWAPSLCFEPWDYYISETVKSGNFPLWYPYQGMGAPLLANFQSAFFYPLKVIIFCLPQNVIPYFSDMSILIKLLIAGFFTYCFMRELSVSKAGSLASSIIFMFNGYFIFYINMAHLNTEMLIPLLFFSLEKLIKKQDFTYTVLGAFVVALIIFGGMPESILFALSVGGLYYLYRMIIINKPDLHVHNLIRPIILLICVMGIGLLISAPQVLPFIELLQNSYNIHSSTMGLARIPFHYDTVTIIVPYFFGIICDNWSGFCGYALLPFIGISAIFLSSFSFKRDCKYLPFALFFGGVSFFFLLKCYAVPIINWVGYLPFFNVSNFPKYLFPEFAFSIAILAGFGLSNIPKMNLKRVLLSFSILTLVICIFGYVNLPSAQKSTWSIAPFGWRFDAVSWMILNCTIALGILILFSIILVIAYRIKLDHRSVSCIILVLIIAEPFMYVPHLHPERVNQFEEPPYITFLKNDSSIYRVVGLDQILYPNTAAPYQIYDIRNLDALQVDRYWKFIKNLIDPTIYLARFTGDNRFSIKKSNSRYLDLCNVKYILSMENYSFSTQETSLVKMIKEQGLIYPEKPDYISINPDGHDIFAHPTSRIFFNMSIPHNNSFLLFTCGLDQKIWTPGRGDGVTFQVIINDSYSEHMVFSKHINPSQNPKDKQWFSETINISEYQGKEVQIQFITLPGPKGNNVYDWAHWKSIDIISGQELEERKKFETQFSLVYDNEIKIYQNRDVLPRAFIVDDVIVRNNESEIFQSMKEPAFNVSKTVIIEKQIPELKNISNSSMDGSELQYNVEIQKYSSNEVLIRATLNKPGLLLLTDTYYPGWIVIVDGRPQEILAGDYLFRAVYLDEGTHSVEFKYQPMSFTLGLWISLFTVSGVVIIYLYIRRRDKNKQQEKK